MINKIVKKYNNSVPLLMTIVILSWGTFAALSKLSLSRIDEYQAQFFMFFWATIGMNIMFLLNRGFEKLAQLKREVIGKLILIAVPSFLYYLFYLYALNEISASEASILNYTFPIFIVIFAVLINGERLNKYNIISILVGFIGVIIILTNGNMLDFKLSNIKGDLYAVIGAVCWAVFSNLGKKVDVNPMVSNYVYTTVCFILSAILVLLKSSFILPGVIAMSGSAFIGLSNIVIGYYLWFRVLKIASTTLVASMSFITPFVTLFFISLLIGESIQTGHIIGLIVILLGTAIQLIKPQMKVTVLESRQLALIGIKHYNFLLTIDKVSTIILVKRLSC